MTKIRPFHRGGILVDSHRNLTKNQRIRPLFLPSVAVIPLVQFSGGRAEWVVETGQWVAEEEVLARPARPRDLPIHSPIPGVVTGFREVTLPGGQVSNAAIVQLEGAFFRTGRTKTSPNWADYSEDDLRNRIQTAGIFAESSPLDPRVHLPEVEPGIDALVVNGLQSEPYLSLSGHLQIETWTELAEGLRILQKVYRPLQTHWAVDLGFEDLVPPSSDPALEKVQFHYLPFRYPQAQRGLLLQTLGLHASSGRHPRVLVLDASSVLAVRDAVADQKPQVEKIVVVSGRGVRNPGLFRVRIGTPLVELLREAGGLKGGVTKVLHGGPFRGATAEVLSSPVLKSTQAVIALMGDEVNEHAERQCIRCGQCVDDCPVGLEPLNLFRALQQSQRDLAFGDGLNLCLECGICSYVCPSRVPLTETFHLARRASHES